MYNTSRNIEQLEMATRCGQMTKSDKFWLNIWTNLITGMAKAIVYALDFAQIQNYL